VFKRLLTSALFLAVASRGCGGEPVATDGALRSSLSILESSSSDWKDLTRAATSLATLDSDEAWTALKRAVLDPKVISRLEEGGKKRAQSGSAEGMRFEEVRAELLAFLRGIASGHPTRATQLLVSLTSSRAYEANKDYSERTRGVYASFKYVKGCPAGLLAFSRSKLSSSKTDGRYKMELMRALATSDTKEALDVFNKFMISRAHYHILLMHRDKPGVLKLFLARLSRATKPKFLRSMMKLLLAEEILRIHPGAILRMKLPPIDPKGKAADAVIGEISKFLWGQERNRPLTTTERRDLRQLISTIRRSNLGNKTFTDVYSAGLHRISVAGHDFDMMKAPWKQSPRVMRYLSGAEGGSALELPGLRPAKGISFSFHPSWGTLAKRGSAVSQVELGNIGLFLDDLHSPGQCRAALLLLHPDFKKSMVSAESYSLLLKGLSSYAFKHLLIKVRVRDSMTVRLRVKRVEDKKVWMLRGAFIEGASVVEYTYVIDKQKRFGRIRRLLMEGPKDPAGLSWGHTPESVRKRREAERIFGLCRSFLLAYPEKVKEAMKKRKEDAGDR
jgi:hypothetical protein